MADSAVPVADATAGGGWRIGPLPPEPIPPEVLELLDGEMFRLLEGFVLTAPAGSGPGTIELRLHEPPSRGRPLLVVLREGQPPDVIDPIEDHGAALFRFDAGAHDGGARLLLLAVRTVVGADLAADTAPAPGRQAPQAPQASPTVSLPPLHPVPPPPPPVSPGESFVPAWVAADLPSSLQPAARAVVRVRLARTPLEPIPGRANRAESLLGAVGTKPLRLKLRRRNLTVVPGTPDHFDDVPFPREGEAPVECGFEVLAGTLGPAEATVVVEQGSSACPLAVVTVQVEVTAAAPASQGSILVQAVTEPPDPRLAGTPVLRIDEDLSPGEWALAFDLDFGDDLVTRYSIRPTVAKDVLLADVYGRIDASWNGEHSHGTHSHEEDHEERGGFEPQLAALGARLAEAVLPEELRRDLNAAWGRLDGLAILSTEAAVPWELAQIGVPEAPRFLGETGLGRWQYGVVHPRRLRARPGRLRYLCPAYAGELALEQTPLEAEFLARLGATAVDPGDSAALSALLRGGGFDVLHFGGHGASDDAGQRLLLVAAQDACGSYPASALSADFPRRRPHPGAEPGPVVVLNACRLAATPRTGADAFASAFLAGGAGAFVGCLWSVGDRPALGFAKAFYAALREGSTVSAAVRAARLAARAAGDASWLAYTAYAHPLATVDFSS